MKRFMQSNGLAMPPNARLYHYTSRIGIENLHRIIVGEMFYFSNPADFNDPLDFSPSVVASSSSDPVTHFPVMAGGSDGKPASQNAFDSPGLPESLALIIGQTIEESKDTHRVLCLSESAEFVLMWAHYANRHRGMCVEIDWTKLPFPPQKVTYDNVVSLTKMSPAQRKFQFQVPHLCVKTCEWQYEKEWRSIVRARSAGEQKFVKLRGAVKSITFGHKMSREDQRMVVDVICELAPEVVMYQAYLHVGKVSRYAVEKSISALGANLHPAAPRPDFAAMRLSRFEPNLSTSDSLLAFRNNVGKNELRIFVECAIEFFGVIKRSPNELIRAVQPIFADPATQEIPSVYWMVLAAAANRATDITLKDSVRRWIPANTMRFAQDMSKVDFSDEYVVASGIDQFFFIRESPENDAHFSGDHTARAVIRLGCKQIVDGWVALRQESKE